MRSLRVIVRGRVQGVGYRWFARETASAHGVSGWVRNRRDGTVEAELHGDDAAVSTVLAALRAGTAHSRVDEVAVTGLDQTVDGAASAETTGVAETRGAADNLRAAESPRAAEHPDAGFEILPTEG